jgi:hypothetical protein
VAGLPLLFMPGVDMALGGTLASLIGWIPLVLFVGWLVWKKKLPVEYIPVADLQAVEAAG